MRAPATTDTMLSRRPTAAPGTILRLSSSIVPRRQGSAGPTPIRKSSAMITGSDIRLKNRRVVGEPSEDRSGVADRGVEAGGGYDLNDDDRYQFFETQIDFDLPGFEDIDDETGEETGIALPYVVTIDRGTEEVLSIRRNWDEDDELKEKKQHFIQYTYIPGFGAYGYGLIHLLGASAMDL